MKTLIVIIFCLVVVNAEELGTAQGYAQAEDTACKLSIQKAISKSDEQSLTTQCQCYRQDGRDWICYTYYKKSKKD